MDILETESVNKYLYKAQLTESELDDLLSLAGMDAVITQVED